MLSSAVDFAQLPWEHIANGLVVVLAAIGVRSPLSRIESTLEDLGARVRRLEALHFRGMPAEAVVEE